MAVASSAPASRRADDYVRLDAVGKRFGAFEALREIDLAVREGEFVCFLGPSGCGKTTLLRVIAGLEAPTSGRVELGGRDVTALPPAERDYGIVFQSYALFPNLTVAENVGYGLANRRLSRAVVRERVTELLVLVGLPGSEEKFPAQMSGGQQQRVALARALATSPRLLLLDEPLSALDAIVRVRLRDEIRALQRKLGVTTIMVTHDQEEALSVADRIVVMNHGVIEQVGSPLEVYRDPSTPFVADFVGKVNILPANVEANGRVRVGEQTWHCAVPARAEGQVKAYLRPEDLLARPIGADDVNVFDSTIDKIEFLGPLCMVHVAAPAVSPAALTVALSLNYLTEQQLRIGSRLPLRVPPDRIRLF
jgi:iron(III) transport system ATP-binding protein